MVRSNPAVFLFTGTDAYSKEKAVEKLKTDMARGVSDDIDYRVFRGGESDPNEIISHIRTSPLFSKNRIIRIREFDQMESGDIKLLSEAIKNLSGATYLVLEAEDDSALRPYPDVLHSVSVRMFGEVKGAGLLSWALDFVYSTSGKTIDKDAVVLLAELKGHLPTDLSGELEKLITFTGDRKSITVFDVEDLVGRSVMASAFDLSWKIGRKDASAALRLATDLTRSGTRPYEIIGILSWHLKRVLRALGLREKGRSDNEIAIELGINRRDADTFFRQLKTFDVKGVRSKIKALLSADLDIKRTRYDQGIVLELAIIRLCLT
jgi:DNA polymerase-3 subunit delta